MKATKLMAIGAVVFGASLGSAAVADPVDNPGDARFFDATGWYPFLIFATTEELLASTEQFEAFADSTGDIFFNSSNMPFHTTQQTIAIGLVPIEAQLFIVDVTGIVDLSGATPFFDWEITAQVRFRATAAGVTSSNCRTASFTIDIDGNWFVNSPSDPFTIPTLSGSGSGACNGNASEINTDFALGNSGVEFVVDKWNAINIASGLALTGS